MSNEIMSRAVAPIERYGVDIAEQSVGGADITYGDIYRVTVAASIKGLQLEQNGFERVDSELVSDLNDFMPLDQEVKDGGQNAIMRARTDAVDKLSHVLKDDEQLDMFLDAVEPDTPLERFVYYISSQTDTSSRTLKFKDVITGSESVYQAVSLQGTVQIQKSIPQEPVKLAIERPKDEEIEDSTDPEEAFNDAVRKLIAEERAKRALAETSADPVITHASEKRAVQKNKKNSKRNNHEVRQEYLGDLRGQIDGVLEGIKVLGLDGTEAIEEGKIIRNIESLPFHVRDLAIARQANLLSCSEDDNLRSYTPEDLALVVAHKQSHKMAYFTVTGKNTSGKRQIMNLVSESLVEFEAQAQVAA